MIKRLAKKYILEGAKICKEYGYWSDELKEYNSKFDYTTMCKLDNILRSEYSSRNTNSKYHDLLILNGLL